MYNITDMSGQKLVTVQAGELLFNALVRAGIKPPDSPCGGKGLCRKCLVKVRSEGEWREVLACQTRVVSDLEIDATLPDAKEQIVLSEGSGLRAMLDPAVRKKYIGKLATKAALCWEEVCRQAGIELSEARPDSIAVLRDLAELARTGKDFTAVISGNAVLAIEAGDTAAQLYGMAFDIGTTTVVGYLLSLNDGRRLATVSTLNPEVMFGADVMSRITAAVEDPAKLNGLRQCIIGCINQLIDAAAQNAGVARESIYDLVFVGNPCMEHLFFGVQPAGLGLAPYLPVLRDALSFKAAEAEIIVNSVARLHWLPGVSGFVGADTVGMMIAQPLEDANEVTVALDIGTNGEMVLAWRDELWSCSTAAGPAFEGAAMSCGVRAQTGAIDKVTITDSDVIYRTIGNAAPQGICGSGIVDAVAALINAGMINKSGKLLEPAEDSPLHSFYVKRNNRAAWLLASEQAAGDGKEVVITQEDIRQLQLAKGAIVAGLKMLLRQAVRYFMQ